ncbi:hypothetical protein ACRAWD_02325 [Caulobacter segnis]
MTRVTQQNAAMVEEATAAAHTLRQETQSLSDLIGKFQFGAVESAMTSRRTCRSPGYAGSCRAERIRASAGGWPRRWQRNAALKTDSWEEF